MQVSFQLSAERRVWKNVADVNWKRVSGGIIIIIIIMHFWRTCCLFHRNYRCTAKYGTVGSNKMKLKPDQRTPKANQSINQSIKTII